MSKDWDNPRPAPSTPVADQDSRKLHAAYDVVARVENAWARDRAQQWQRTLIVVRELVEAGLLPGGELIGGKYYAKSATEAPRSTS